MCHREHYLLSVLRCLQQSYLAQAARAIPSAKLSHSCAWLGNTYRVGLFTEPASGRELPGGHIACYMHGYCTACVTSLQMRLFWGGVLEYTIEPFDQLEGCSMVLYK